VNGLWQDAAACLGADPELFWTDRANDDAVDAMRDIARHYCAGCPVLHACAADADRSRHQGLWGGSLRSGATNKYERTPLIDHAPLNGLADRRAGVHHGWKTA
jgi:hypothetical protein